MTTNIGTDKHPTWVPELMEEDEAFWAVVQKYFDEEGSLAIVASDTRHADLLLQGVEALAKHDIRIPTHVSRHKTRVDKLLVQVLVDTKYVRWQEFTATVIPSQTVAALINKGLIL